MEPALSVKRTIAQALLCVNRAFRRAMISLRAFFRHIPAFKGRRANLGIDYLLAYRTNIKIIIYNVLLTGYTYNYRVAIFGGQRVSISKSL